MKFLMRLHVGSRKLEVCDIGSEIDECHMADFQARAGAWLLSESPAVPEHEWRSAGAESRECRRGAALRLAASAVVA